MEIISGVYKIENKNNHKVYIGSAKDIYKRWKEHLYALKNNKHHSCKLQASYNRLKDKDTLDFSIVEVVENPDELRLREQYYIDLYDAFHSGYNCSEKVDNPKYTFKNVKKASKRKLENYLYDEFKIIYDANIFRFPPKILSKIELKQYKHDGIRKIIILMKLYLKYFGRTGFACRIFFDSKICYMEIWANKSDYVEYKFKDDMAIAYFPVSKCDVKMQKSRTTYSHDLHRLFKRFNVLKQDTVNQTN